MNSCAQRHWVERHFDQRISFDDECAMRRHLPDCEDCRQYYQRLLVGARLDPRAPSPQERLGRALGLAPAPRRRSWWQPTLALGAALAACVLLVVARPVRDGFTARGGKLDDRSEVLVYRAQAGKAAQRLGRGARVAANAELAFAYRNPEGYPWLAIFAVDEHNHIYWYYPAWLDAKADPSMVAAARTPAPIELSDAVAHSIDGRHLKVHWLFAGAPLTVKQIEQRVLAGQEALWTAPAARQATLELEIE
jgi:hypothetical protein